MAKRKTTTRKKKTTKKKAAARRAPSRKKKTSSKKKSAARRKSSSKKKTRKKPAARKKSSKKKKSAAKKRPAKKKVAKKKAAARKKAPKKKVKKKAPKKKAPNKKVTKKKAAATKKKTTKAAGKKSRAKSSGSRRGVGRSVAEVASTATADAQGYVFINGRRVRMISTKGHVATKKTKTASKAAAAVEVAAKPAKPIKTKLGRKELNHYRNELLLRRAELVGDLSAMETEALRSGGDNLSHMPIHMADIGTDTYDQDFMLGLAEKERQRLREIDEALMRIKDGTYGVCMMTGRQIPKARLEAKPWAKYTIEAARQLEGGWTP